jgi:hypothetical protein
MPNNHARRPALAGSLLLAAVLAAGCAGDKPAAREQLAAGQSQVEAAIAATAGAPDLSVAEMSTARDKLEKARAAQRARDWESAARLAEQAAVDAEVARAKIAADKSRRAAAEIDASLAALREELNRQPAGATAAPVRP